MVEETYDLLVLNGIVVTTTATGEYDIAVKNEKVAQLVPRGQLKHVKAKRVIDARGGYVTPGGVDAHVHLAEPALFGKGRSADDYESGSRSAIAGGTTTLITFAPQRKTEPSLLACLETTHGLAKDQCYTDYSFHLICSNASPIAISEFPALRKAGISSLKIYMTYAALKLGDEEILDVLFAARKHGLTTMIHAENDAVITWMTKKLEERGLYDPVYHAVSHVEVAEIEATYRAISLGSFIDTPILIVHVSSPAAAAHIRSAQLSGLPVYAETCPQYLFLLRKDLDVPLGHHDPFAGAKCVCSPPPRQSEKDHEAIWQGLENGTFTILSSDHCPFLYEDTEIGKKSVLSKEFPNGHFKYIPNGCPGVETRLPLVFSQGRLDKQKFVEVTATNPAKLYGVWPRKGDLIPGQSDADIVVWYPEEGIQGAEGEGGMVITNDKLHHATDYTPYEGITVKQWPRYTILRGKVVWDREGDGVVGEKGYGVFLERGESLLKGKRREGEWKVEDF